MKYLPVLSILFTLAACSTNESLKLTPPDNPFFTDLNVATPYGQIRAEDVKAYGEVVLERANQRAEAIRQVSNPTFDNIIRPYDDLANEMNTASNNCFMLYWVSPDSLTRIHGYAAYKKLDSLSTAFSSDRTLYNQVLAVSEKENLKGSKKWLVNDLLTNMRHAGVNLEANQLEKYKSLSSEINDLSSQYTNNMNTDPSKVVLTEAEAEGLPENFKKAYKQDDGDYHIPTIPATQGPVLNNAAREDTRKRFYMAYNNRAADNNMDVLDQLVSKRHEVGKVMGHNSYAAYNTEVKMAGNPGKVWDFVNDLIERTGEKAAVDLARLKEVRSKYSTVPAGSRLMPWNLGYFHNQLLKSDYQVDQEKIREYLVMDNCLQGMMDIYQELLDLEFKKVEDPSVWHESVEMYEVYEEGKLSGVFYLDLFPRPNKESWFYGVRINSGKKLEAGYEVPRSMLLGNFTPANGDVPSLLSFSELNTLFHEFGHIMDGMSYKGEFALQAGSKADFGEAMSQIFENWIWDYDILKGLTSHYKTGEVLPKETFDRMVEAKNVISGISAQSSLRRCVYDLMLYDRFDPETPMQTDEIWREIDKRFVMPQYVEGTHPQTAWIHINGYPVYYYGYLWSEVYAQDMYTEFEKNGLLDTETGVRYRKLILANGGQRPIEEAVEEFLGRKSNNKAYIKSLGL